MIGALGYGGYAAADAEDAADGSTSSRSASPSRSCARRISTIRATAYYSRPIADLIAANPDFDWPAFLEHLGIPEEETIVVTELKYLSAVDAILAKTDLETLKDYLKLQILLSTASALSEEMGQTLFDFYGTTLNGVEEREPLAERALSDVNGALGFALGQLYVDEHFPPEAKAEIEKLVARLIAATRVRIEALDWMSPETKETALAKLDAMRVKVGYPDEWRTYEGVTIEESLAETLLSANLAEAKRQFDRIDKPVDREEWHMLPQRSTPTTVRPTTRSSFPPRSCNHPSSTTRRTRRSTTVASAPPSATRSHGFDQSGSQFDAEGNLVNWWSEEDLAEFEALAAEVAAQYDAVEALPGLNVDGDLTIGENIADMGGLQIAYDALQATLAAEGDPGLIEGLTQEERFFIAYAYSWAEKAREQAIGPRCSPTSTPRPRCARCNRLGTWTVSSRRLASSQPIPCIFHRRSASSSGNAPGCSMLRDEYFDTAKVSFRGTASCTRNLVVVRLMARMSGCCSRTQRDVFTMSE